MDRGSWPKRWRMDGLRIVTMDDSLGTFEGSIEVAGGRIAAVGPHLPAPGPGIARLDRHDWVALPGFIQGHLHLCQTLFRGLADRRRLDRWLGERIWPLEAAHDDESLVVSARLGIAEALLAGATTILDMGTVRGTDRIARVIEEMGIRAIIGQALMDTGEGVPEPLRVDPDRAWAEAKELCETFDGAGEGRIGVAYAPRFTLSVSEDLWRKIATEARRTGRLVHTHISETPWENETCRRLHGGLPLEVLERWGVLEAPTALVHAVWIDEGDRERLRRSGAGVVHCPGSNAKLGSGIADVAALLEADIPVALGSDAAACDDALSIPLEMRLASQLQCLRHGPERLPATAPLEMATSLGARVLGWAERVGSLTPGKEADLVLYRRDDLPWPAERPLADALTWTQPRTRPREVIVAGRRLVADGALVEGDENEIRAEATAQRRAVWDRSGLE